MKTNEILKSGSAGRTQWWVVESVKNGFAKLTQLEWSTDLINEKGVMRRTSTTLRRKLRNGGIYDRALGNFRKIDSYDGEITIKKSK